MNKPIFSADKPKVQSAKIHYLNLITKKSFCGRSNSTWLDTENIETGANVTRNPNEVTCKFCLHYKNIWR
jgi:hypothetical protein